MKRKLDKYDFLAINRRLNQNRNARRSCWDCNDARKITKGEELRLCRKESKTEDRKR